MAQRIPSERITWVTCPECGARAALGWAGGRPIEFDCVAECRLSPADLQRRFGTLDAGASVPRPGHGR